MANKFVSISNFFLCIVTIPVIFYSACKEEEVDFNSNECKVSPPFIKNFGFSTNQMPVLSTTEKRIPGLVLMQMNYIGDTSNGGKKTFQHPSWKMAGNLGPIQIDPSGNVFVAPVPTVNTLMNPTNKQNTLYKVDANSGEMKAFVSFPVPDSIPPTNPFGILGLAYLCEANVLYVSSVMGSDRKSEKGVIYAINEKSGEIIDKLKGVDAIGIGISYISSQRRLYYGSARTPNVYSIKLKQDGSFSGNPKFELSVDSLSLNGNDRVRRIRFEKFGQMAIGLANFNFNLYAPTQSNQDQVLQFKYDEDAKQWINDK